MNITVMNLRTVEGITEYTEKFLMEAYGLTLDIPVKINSRLTKMLGAMVEINDKSSYIEFAKRLIDFGDEAIIENIVKHEAIHYALKALGRDYEDGAEDFENELNKQGAARSQINVYHVGKRFKCKCSTCGDTWTEVSKNQNKYVSICCKANIDVVSEVYGDGFKLIKEKNL